MCLINKVCDAFISLYPITEVCGVFSRVSYRLVWVSNQEHASLSFMADFFLVLDYLKGLSLFFKIYFYFMCMDVSPARMSVHMHICGWGLYM